ncbi:MAG: hypothetical protein ACTSRW_02125 [Candidatus Helarchaeota archaeon]
MTMMEDFTCENCGKKSFKEHLCSPNMVKKEHSITKEEIAALKFYCGHCGRVSPIEENLCKPQPIDPEMKAKFEAVKITAGKAPTCKNCDQPVSPPGHVCDPRLPYTCKYCGVEVKDMQHICSGYIEASKYFCKLCGRLAPEKDMLCSSWELK